VHGYSVTVKKIFFQSDLPRVEEICIWIRFCGAFGPSCRDPSAIYQDPSGPTPVQLPK